MISPSSIDAIVVAYDSSDALPDCLAALAREGVASLVVDNASPDGSADIAERLGARVLRLARNEGYGRANNAGIRTSTAEYVLVVNPDVVLDPGAVAALLAAVSRYPDAGMWAPRIVEPDGRVHFSTRSLLATMLTNPKGLPCRPEGDCCAPFILGACFLIRRELFLELGGFDERIFLFYEDDDLCRRLTDSGHALIHVHDAVARHARGHSSAPAPGRIFRSRWHQAWSRAYVSEKYGLPGSARRMLLLNLPKALLAGVTFRRDLVERYGGSAAGAWGYLCGRTALAREGLDRTRTALRLGAPTIGEALARPSNGFTLVRLALALAVVVSHAFSVTTGVVEDEPLARATGFTLGEHAVNGFFVLSGFLVTMSFERRGWRDYVVARTLRIVPGLVVAAFVVALGLGSALSTLGAAAYLTDPGPWRFLAGLMTSLKTNVALPGVFPDNPIRMPMGTVWTLKYEIFCYLGVLAAGLAGCLRRRWPAALLAAAFLAAVVVLDLRAPEAGKSVQTSVRLLFLFTAGGAFYLWRDTVRLSAVALGALALATWLAAGSPAYRGLLFLVEAYGGLWIAFLPALARPAFDLESDLSYGTYLYGWPIQQALLQIVPGAAALTLLLPSIVLSLAVAAASWFLIEKPALAFKARALGRRTIRTIEPAGS